MIDGLLIVGIACGAYFILGRPFVMVLSKTPERRQYLWPMWKIVLSIVLIASNLLAGGVAVLAFAATLILFILNH